MVKTVPADEPQTLACEVCLSEIPASVAQSLEGPDYVHHFCGLECYARWTGAPKTVPDEHEEPQKDS